LIGPREGRDPPPKSTLWISSSHTIFSFYRSPSRRSGTHHLHEPIHIVFRDAIDVDAVPVSTHDEDNVLCVALRASTTSHGTTPQCKTYQSVGSMRNRCVEQTRDAHHPRVQLGPYEFGRGQEWYATNGCHRERIEASRARLSRRQDFNLKEDRGIISCCCG
jgi:hypothetical protein